MKCCYSMYADIHFVGILQVIQFNSFLFIESPQGALPCKIKANNNTEATPKIRQHPLSKNLVTVEKKNCL